MGCVEPIPALADNYIWIAAATAERRPVIVIDPGEAEPVRDWLSRNGSRIAAILLTHHHPDHTAGAAELAREYAAPFYGPGSEKIRGVDHPLSGGETLDIDGVGRIEVIAVPGHTQGHLAYHWEDALFSGDTLFAGGCGRLFEGNAKQMSESLSRLARLADSTCVYCGHEYTVKNLEFAHRLEPDNQQLARRLDQARELRINNQPTLPSTIGEEKATNPFMRATDAEFAASISRHTGEQVAAGTQLFATLRRWKDRD